MRQSRMVMLVMAVTSMLILSVATAKEETSITGDIGVSPAFAHTKSTKHHKHHRTRHKRRWRYRPPALRFYHLESTAYGLTGRMSNGRYTHDGAVAVPRSWPLGGWYQVRSGPLKGKVLHAEDHIGWGSQFDIWMPYSRTAQYGRRTILVARIKPRHARRVLRFQHKRHF